MKKSKRETLLIIGALLFSVGFTLLLKWWQNAPLFDMSTLIFSTGNFISVILIGGLFEKLMAYNSRITVAESRKKIIPLFILFMLATTFMAILPFWAGLYILAAIEGGYFPQSPAELLSNESGAFRSVSAGLIAIYTIFFYTIWKQSVTREQLLREENLAYKYKTLKSQVNPHFLFNSLNTLSEIVYTDSQKADLYIQKLAAIYRYILEHEESLLIPLEEELLFVRNYFDLQKERTGDKALLDIDLPDNRLLIIPVSLQILIENALKHNIASDEHPLRIHIYQEGDTICVSNPVQKRGTLPASPGTGLANLSERCRLMMGKEMIINRENNCFTIKLPIKRSEK